MALCLDVGGRGLGGPAGGGSNDVELREGCLSRDFCVLGTGGCGLRCDVGCWLSDAQHQVSFGDIISSSFDFFLFIFPHVPPMPLVLPGADSGWIFIGEIHQRDVNISPHVSLPFDLHHSLTNPSVFIACSCCS